VGVGSLGQLAVRVEGHHQLGADLLAVEFGCQLSQRVAFSAPTDRPDGRPTERWIAGSDVLDERVGWRAAVGFQFDAVMSHCRRL
jgi:hypothetical protein